VGEIEAIWLTDPRTVSVPPKVVRERAAGVAQFGVASPTEPMPTLIGSETCGCYSSAGRCDRCSKAIRDRERRTPVVIDDFGLKPAYRSRLTLAEAGRVPR
jgi:hypothetical protein